MPNFLIVDYGVGLPGSQHDAPAWAETRLPQEHEDLFERNEWVWGDSAYPLQKWCQAPYKKYVSRMYEMLYHLQCKGPRRTHMITHYTITMFPRCASAQSTAWASSKGRGSSLLGLQILINESAHIHFASLWITSCIVLHTFAMRHEAGLELSSDEFYLEGVRIMEEERILGVAQKATAEKRQTVNGEQREANREIDLLEGKLMRENLKKELFEAL